jgi:hypothetical protein
MRTILKCERGGGRSLENNLSVRMWGMGGGEGNMHRAAIAVKAAKILGHL